MTARKQKAEAIPDLMAALKESLAPKMRCPRCLGRGDVLSLVDARHSDALALLPCDECDGNGWVAIPADPNAAPPPEAA